MQSLIIIWFLLPSAIQAAVLFLLVRRRLYRKGMFPFFSSYTLYSIVVTIFRLMLVQRPGQYVHFYWSTEVVYGMLAILSLNEVFSRTFFLDYQEHPWLRLALPSTVLLIFLGLFYWWRFVYQTPTGDHLGLFSSAFVGFNQGVHSVEGILLVLFMVLRIALVPGWNRYDYGILLGFGLSGLITMTADIVRFKAGHGYQIWYKYAPGITYVLVTAIWFHAFWQAPSPQQQPLIRFRTMLEQARLNNEVIRVIHEWLNRAR